MAKWKYRIDLTDVWGKAQGGEMSTRELASVVAERIKVLPPYKDESDPELLELADEFETLADDPGIDDVDFNNVFERLYDWADQSTAQTWPPSKMCWVATRF